MSTPTPVPPSAPTPDESTANAATPATPEPTANVAAPSTPEPKTEQKKKPEDEVNSAPTPTPKPGGATEEGEEEEEKEEDEEEEEQKKEKEKEKEKGDEKEETKGDELSQILQRLFNFSGSDKEKDELFTQALNNINNQLKEARNEIKALNEQVKQQQTQIEQLQNPSQKSEATPESKPAATSEPEPKPEATSEPKATSETPKPEPEPEAKQTAPESSSEATQKNNTVSISYPGGKTETFENVDQEKLKGIFEEGVSAANKDFEPSDNASKFGGFEASYGKDGTLNLSFPDKKEAEGFKRDFLQPAAEQANEPTDSKTTSLEQSPGAEPPAVTPSP